MTNLKLFLTFAFLATGSISYAQNAAETAVERLFTVTNIESVHQTTINQMLDIQMQANPTLTPFRNTLQVFFEKHIGFEKIKPEMVKLYTENFTAEDLHQIADFYETPVGRKALIRLPQLMEAGAQIGMRRIQENTAELEAMIRAEAERIDSEQNQPPTQN